MESYTSDWGMINRAINVQISTHQETSHSATYSTPTMHPRTDQYISHRSRSASDAGRCESVLYDAYPGYRKATKELHIRIQIKLNSLKIRKSLRDSPDDSSCEVDEHFGEEKDVERQERSRSDTVPSALGELSRDSTVLPRLRRAATRPTIDTLAVVS